MPRKPREEVVDGIFHIYARGNDRRVVYRDDGDRRMYLRLLARTVKHRHWRALAYCLMSNHVHLLIETPRPNLGAGMRWLHGLYARQFNDRHGRSGHVFQGRYGAVGVERDEQLWATAAYIAMNPVEAGLCDAPEKWPWSSHAVTVGGGGPRWLDVDRLLHHLAGGARDPRRAYAAMLQGEMREARPPGPGFAGGNSLVASPRGATAGAAPSR